MAAELEIRDACPHCGQLVAVRLAATQPAPGGHQLPVIVDPRAARLRAVDSRSDHPCPEERQSS